MSSFNHHNQDYYQLHGTTGVPDLLAAALPVQEALRLCIESLIPSDPIKILELGFGSRPDRYKHIAATSRRLWDVVLSDFSLNILPPPSPNYRRLALNLLSDSFPAGPFDAILSTYTFDSVNFPEDRYVNGHHYPGGLIRIAKAVAPILTSHGIFLTIDKISSSAPLSELADGAVFKSLDLAAASQELRQAGFNATFESLDDFLHRYHQQLPFNLSDHGCLLITY